MGQIVPDSSWRRGGTSIASGPEAGYSSASASVGSTPRPGRGLTRGFFSNSASGDMDDLNRFMDPTTLAVLGILLTLVATSLSLVKGS